MGICHEYKLVFEVSNPTIKMSCKHFLKDKIYEQFKREVGMQFGLYIVPLRHLLLGTYWDIHNKLRFYKKLTF